MKQAFAAQSQRENQKARHNGDLSHLAVRAVTDHEMPSSLHMGRSTSHFGHDFSQAAVRPGAAMVGRDYGTASCPAFPRTCPFGGACHTCPAQVQTKLTVNEPGDKYEQEADRMADLVMRMPEPGVGIQRSCSECDEEIQRQPEEAEDEEDPIQTKAVDGVRLQRQEALEEEEEEILQAKGRGAQIPDVTDAVASEIHAMQGSGRPLPRSERSFFEPRFGYDFGEVRVHADTRAAEAARAVQACAFTTGRNVVFGAGEYAPGTLSGRRLLGHELVHVIQQSHNMTATQRTNVKDRTTKVHRVTIDTITRGRQQVVPFRRNYPHLQRQPQTTSLQPVTPNAQQQRVIRTARHAAAIRTQVALFRVAGLGPPSPSRRSNAAADSRRRATALARTIFAWQNPNLDQISRILSSMVTFLAPGAQFMIAGRNDPECGTRDGYVRGYRTPVVLCPAFFRTSATPESQARTVVHESAHLARVGPSTLAEHYCTYFDCQSSCGGFNSADSWAHFVNCLSDQPADQPPVTQGRVPGRSRSGVQPQTGASER